jgi:hypothetical protein
MLMRDLNLECLERWYERCQVQGRFGRMRKDDLYLVFPLSDGRLFLQGIRSVAVLDYRNLEATYSTKGSCASFLHSGITVAVDPKFVAECLRVCPSAGGETEIEPGVWVQHTVEL